MSEIQLIKVQLARLVGRLAELENAPSKCRCAHCETDRTNAITQARMRQYKRIQTFAPASRYDAWSKLPGNGPASFLHTIGDSGVRAFLQGLDHDQTVHVLSLAPAQIADRIIVHRNPIARPRVIVSVPDVGSTLGGTTRRISEQHAAALVEIPAGRELASLSGNELQSKDPGLRISRGTGGIGWDSNIPTFSFSGPAVFLEEAWAAALEADRNAIVPGQLTHTIDAPMLGRWVELGWLKVEPAPKSLCDEQELEDLAARRIRPTLKRR